MKKENLKPLYFSSFFKLKKYVFFLGLYLPNSIIYEKYIFIIEWLQ